MLKAIPLAQAAVQGAVFAADGFLASRDTNAQLKANAAATPPATTPTSPPLTKSWAVRMQGAALATGVLGEFLNWPADITEGLILPSLSLMAREATIRGLQGAKGVQAQGMAAGMRAHVHRSHARAAVAPSGGVAGLLPSSDQTALVGAAG